MEIKINSKKHGTYTMLIDDEDYFNLKNKSISITKCGNKFYAQDSERNRIHQLICGKKCGLVVDHINGNTLDNRRENLRLTTSSQNNKNRNGYGRIKYKFMSYTIRNNRPNNCHEVKFPNMKHRAFVNIEEAKAYYIECLLELEGGL